MPQYRRVGDVPPKRHTVHRSSTGRLAEELMGEEGFSGASSLLYHRFSPSGFSSAESVVIPRDCPAPNNALLPCISASGASARPATPSRAGGRCSATPTSRSPGCMPPDRASCTATPAATRSCSLPRAEPSSSRSSDASRSLRAITSSCRPRRRIAGSWRRGRYGCWSWRRAVT